MKLPGGPGQFTFIWDDGIQFLKRPFPLRTLIYCDPPYVHSTRSRSDIYQYEMTDAQHLDLLSLLRTIPASIVISGYESSLYRKELKGWNSVQFDAMTRRGLKTEWLWFNFDPPVELHDYRYLGENFRERERIKRKKQRWVARLNRMPLLEKRCLLLAIAEHAGTGEGFGSIVRSGDTRGG